MTNNNSSFSDRLDDLEDSLEKNKKIVKNMLDEISDEDNNEEDQEDDTLELDFSDVETGEVQKEDSNLGIELPEGFGSATFTAALQRGKHLGKFKAEEKLNKEDPAKTIGGSDFNSAPPVNTLRDPLKDINPLKTMRGTSFGPIPLLSKEEKNFKVESSELIIPKSFAETRKVVEPSATKLMLEVGRGIKARKITQDILDSAPVKTPFTGPIPLLDQPRNLTKDVGAVKRGFGRLNLGKRTSTLREFSRDFGASVGGNLREVSSEIRSTSAAIAKRGQRQLGRNLQRVRESEKLREGVRLGIRTAGVSAKGFVTGASRVNQRFFVPLGQRESLFGPRLGTISDREKELINITSGGTRSSTPEEQQARQSNIDLLEKRNKEILVELAAVEGFSTPTSRLLEVEFKENRLKIAALQIAPIFSSSQVAVAKAELEQFTKSRDAKRASQAVQLKTAQAQSAASVSRIQKAGSRLADRAGRSLLNFDGGLVSTERTKRTLAALRGDDEFDDDPFRNLDELFLSDSSGRSSLRASTRPQINIGSGEKTVTEKSRQQLTLKGKGRIERVNVQIDTPI